jgi:hypothetical protein
MRYGAKTEAAPHPPDPISKQKNQIVNCSDEEITRIRSQMFESTNRNSGFLDWFAAASAAQLGMESSAHRCQPAKSGCWKRQRDRGRAKALRCKLHDLPRAIWKR